MWLIGDCRKDNNVLFVYRWTDLTDSAKITSQFFVELFPLCKRCREWWFSVEKEGKKERQKEENHWLPISKRGPRLRSASAWRLWRQRGFAIAEGHFSGGAHWLERFNLDYLVGGQPPRRLGRSIAHHFSWRGVHKTDMIPSEPWRETCHEHKVSMNFYGSCH